MISACTVGCVAFDRAMPELVAVVRAAKRLRTERTSWNRGDFLADLDTAVDALREKLRQEMP